MIVTSSKEMPLAVRTLLRESSRIQKMVELFQGAIVQQRRVELLPAAIMSHCVALMDMRLATAGRQPCSSDVYDFLKEQSRAARQPIGQVSTLELQVFFSPLLQTAWSVETADPSTQNWSSQTPEQGQQVSTALVAQTFLGGRFLMGVDDRNGLRIWNSVGEAGLETEVDLTCQPFCQAARMTRSTVQFCGREDVARQRPWAELAAEQLLARIRDLLLPYALAGYLASR